MRQGRQYALPESSRKLAADALHAAGGIWRWLARLAGCQIGRGLLAVVEWLSLPGLAEHHVRRKAWIMRRLREQPLPMRWLWLGVGLDGSGRALHEALPDIELHEFDQPGALGLRQQLLGASSVQPLRLPEDGALLRQHCAQAPSTVVLEGVAMYLPARPLRRLLRTLSRLPRPPRLLFSALDAATGARRGFAREHGLTRRWLAARREPFLWRLPQRRMESLLRRSGYRVTACWAGSAFGEYVIDAEPG